MEPLLVVVDWSVLLAAPTVCVILGAIFLLLAISGGGVRFRGLELPQISALSGDGAAMAGVAFLSVGVYSLISAARPAQQKSADMAVESLDCSQSPKSDVDSDVPQPATVDFMNDSERTLNGFWVKYNGESKQFFNILPNIVSSIEDPTDFRRPRVGPQR